MKDVQIVLGRRDAIEEGRGNRFYNFSKLK